MAGEDNPVRLRLILTIVCIVLWAGSRVGGQTAPPVDAQTVWEQTIKAKGGRERLHAIKNLLAVEPSRGKPDRPYLVDLWVFPDKSWRWHDDLEGYLGLNLNVSSRLGWWSVSEHRRPSQYRTAHWSPPNQGRQNAVVAVQAEFLLETAWYQPRILSLSSGRIGRREYHVITAEIPERVRYYIDKQTYLVRRLESAEEWSPDRLIILAPQPWEFEDYAPVDGIMMPKRQTVLNPRAGNTRYTFQFEFNVEYEPTIFDIDRKPALEDGPEGWKRR